MAGKAEYKVDRQPGGRAGQERSGGDETSPARVSVPELPAVSMDAVGSAVLVCAADGTIVDLNRAAALMLGVDPAAARGTSLQRGAAVGRDLGDRVR